MNQLLNSKNHKLVYWIIGIGVVIIIIYIGFNLTTTSSPQVQNKDLETKIVELEEALRNANDSLARVQKEKTDLNNTLAAAAEKNKAFATELDNVTNTIESFERLKQIDPELLQKYSKVYFLNENYIPSALTTIDTKYLFTKNRPLEFHDRAWSFLREMLEDASKAGIELKVASAYRSFGTQATLKSNYKVTYGSGANAFSADQGYSEHQLGTTIDVTTQAVGGSFSGFEKSPAYTWLQNNAHKYGFALSYPKNNAFYVFEPWHWRFVGIELASKLHSENKFFYDLEQRDISTYLRYMFNATTTPVNN